MPGLLPTCWGSSGWHLIHSVAYAYTPSDSNKQKYFEFFKNLGYVLPCDECKIHYRQNLNEEKLKAALESRDALFKWTYDLHNLVNEQTGKPRDTWPSFEDVKKRYQSYEVACDAVPGVCGAKPGAPSYNQRSTAVVDKVGPVTEDSIPYMSAMIALAVLCAGLVAYYVIYPRLVKNSSKKLRQ